MKSPGYHAADYCFVLEDCDLLSTLLEPLKCHFPSPGSLFKSFWMSVFWSLDVFFMFIVEVQMFVLVKRKAVNLPLCVTWCCFFFLNLSRPNIPGSYWRHISFFFFFRRVVTSFWQADGFVLYKHTTSWSQWSSLIIAVPKNTFQKH